MRRDSLRWQRSNWTPYFTLPRIRAIAYQCLDALAFIHSNHLIHCDLKPENVLIKSLSRCVVKVRRQREHTRQQKRTRQAGAYA